MFTYHNNEYRVSFRWHQGPYIEISFDDMPPNEVINVWDYKTSQPEISTRSEFVRTCRQWIAETLSDDDGHNLEAYRENASHY